MSPHSTAEVRPEQSATLEFDHIAQQVPSVGDAVAWYQCTFPSCRVHYRDETWALIEVGGVKLAFVRAGDHPPHVAWRVPDGELDRLARSMGGEVETHRDGSRSFYIIGPGSNSIEIISYPVR